jgi:hypothetical protein
LGEFTLGNFWSFFVLIHEGLKNGLGTEFEIGKLISELVDPGDDIVVLLFVEMDDPFEIVHIPVELEEHLF